MLCTIASLEAQNKGFKIVPDSLCCITPAQVSRHIEDAYVLKGQAFSLILEAKSIENLNMAVDKLKDQVTQKDAEIKLRVLQNDNWQEDYLHLNRINVLANKKIARQKACIRILGIIGLGELGYIGIRSIIP